jgi:hypothetical protein
MVLVERETGIPLDLVVFINSYLLSEELTDENFQQAIALWFENEEECRFRFGHISSELRICKRHFRIERTLTKT